MLTLRLPFPGESTFAILIALGTENPISPSTHNPKIPKPLNDLVLHLLAKVPGDRPVSADEVITRLQSMEGTLPIPVAVLAERAARQHRPENASEGAAGRAIANPVGHHSQVSPGQGSAHRRGKLGPGRPSCGRDRPAYAIVTALHLADMTGVELAQQVRTECKEAAPGFVLISSEGGRVGSGLAQQVRQGYPPAEAVHPREVARRAEVRVIGRGSGKVRVLIVDDSAPAPAHPQRARRPWFVAVCGGHRRRPGRGGGRPGEPLT